MRTGQLVALVLLTAVVAVLGTLVVLRHFPPVMHRPQGREAMVHEMGAEVMPFSLDSTTHVFEMTTTGGIQQVIAKDPADSATIRLIRQHLMHEATQFRSGDFSDPMALHGKDMPGLEELSAGAERVQVEFAALPDGGQITFTTSDLSLLTAIHRWFGAQLSDHGADATYR